MGRLDRALVGLSRPAPHAVSATDARLYRDNKNRPLGAYLAENCAIQSAMNAIVADAVFVRVWPARLRAYALCTPPDLPTMPRSLRLA